LSRGLVEAMSGTLRPEGTPGGGLTMIISLPAAAPPSGDAEAVGAPSITARLSGEPAHPATE